MRLGESDINFKGKVSQGPLEERKTEVPDLEELPEDYLEELKEPPALEESHDYGVLESGIKTPESDGSPVGSRSTYSYWDYLKKAKASQPTSLKL